MWKFGPIIFAPPPGGAARCDGSRCCLMFGWVLFAIAAAGTSAADELGPIASPKLDPAIAHFVPFSLADVPATHAAGDFTLATADGIPDYSSTEFRPRRPALLENDPVGDSFRDAPLIRSTTVWQRLADYKSHDRVRVLTLWETTGSSVSLQAGKHGDPSLQWTSRIMNRGGSTHGVLDRLFSVSIVGAANSIRSVTRSANSPSMPKSFSGNSGSSAPSVAAAK